MKKVTVPGVNVPLVGSGGLLNPDWYLVFKFIESLQPLSDIPAPVLPGPITPGNTPVSVTPRSVSLSQSGTGSVTNVLGWVSPNNQSLYDSFATLQSIITSLSTNDSNAKTAIDDLNSRVTALENKINALIAAL